MLVGASPIEAALSKKEAETYKPKIKQNGGKGKKKGRVDEKEFEPTDFSGMDLIEKPKKESNKPKAKVYVPSEPQ